MLRFSFYFFLMQSFLFSNANLKNAKRAYSQKNYNLAIELFEKEIVRNPQSGDIYFFIGQAYMRQNKFDEAIHTYKQALNLELKRENRIDCYVSIILYYQKFAMWREVFDYSSQLLELKLKSNLNYIQKIKDVAEKNLQDKIYIDYDKVDSISYLNQVLYNQPDNLKIRWQLAVKYFQNKDYKNSHYHLSILIQKEPKNINYLYKQSINFIHLEQIENAIYYLNQILKLANEEHSKILYYANINLGNLYFKKSAYQKSINHYRTAYLKIRDFPPLLGIAKVKYTVNDCKNVIKIVERALQYKKHLLELNAYKALCLVKEDKTNFNFLETIAKKILKKYPEDNIPNKYYPVFYELGVFYFEEKKYFLSQKYFEHLPVLYHQEKENFYYQGLNFYYLKEFKKSISYLEKIKEISYEGLYKIAQSYANLNQIEKTKKYIQKASKLNLDVWKNIQIDQTFNYFMQDINFQYYILNKGKNLEITNLTNSVQPIQTEKKNSIPTFQIPAENLIQKKERIENPKNLKTPSSTQN